MQMPSAKTWMHIHAFLTPLWFLLVIPTVLFWSESVLWVALISCYANAVGHFSAWQATRSEVETEKQEKKS
jgi:hypothetical protein